MAHFFLRERSTKQTVEEKFCSEFLELTQVIFWTTTESAPVARRDSIFQLWQKQRPRDASQI